MEQFVGKEVQLFPNDTYSKFAILEEVNEYGFVFRITESQASEYKEGDKLFYSHSRGVIFKLKNI